MKAAPQRVPPPVRPNGAKLAGLQAQGQGAGVDMLAQEVAAGLAKFSSTLAILWRRIFIISMGGCCAPFKPQLRGRTR
eukprot:14249245-Alexandrium_andersonii.AAC.1